MIRALLSQLILSSYLPSGNPNANNMEHTTLNAILILQSLFTFIILLTGIGSAAIFFMSVSPLFLVLVVNWVLARTGIIKEKRVPLRVHFRQPPLTTYLG
jgi:succinate-acetate transporter protein